MTKKLFEKNKIVPYHYVIRIEIKGKSALVSYNDHKTGTIKVEKSLPELFCEYIKSLILQDTKVLKDNFELVSFKKEDLEG